MVATRVSTHNERKKYDVFKHHIVSLMQETKKERMVKNLQSCFET